MIRSGERGRENGQVVKRFLLPMRRDMEPSKKANPDDDYYDDGNGDGLTELQNKLRLVFASL